MFHLHIVYVPLLHHDKTDNTTVRKVCIFFYYTLKEVRVLNNETHKHVINISAHTSFNWCKLKRFLQVCTSYVMTTVCSASLIRISRRAAYLKLLQRGRCLLPAIHRCCSCFPLKYNFICTIHLRSDKICYGQLEMPVKPVVLT